MSKLKESYISFRSDEAYFRRINELADKLGVSRSEGIRLILDEGFERYLGQKSDLLVVDRAKFNAITKGLSKRLTEEISQEIIRKIVKQVQESPKIRKLYELAKEGKLEIKEKP